MSIQQKEIRGSNLDLANGWISILAGRINSRQRRGSQCVAKESFDRAESTNCSQQLSLGFPAWGKRGEGWGKEGGREGVYSGAQQVLRYKLCVVGGGGSYYACYTPPLVVTS